MTRTVVHPGPRRDFDHLAVPTRARPVSLTLRAGDVLLPALERELSALGCDSAWLEPNGVHVSRLDYVGPHWPSPDGRRVAWYSETRHVSPPGEIVDMGLFFGRKDGAPFLHGHGLWRGADGSETFGHVLADACVIAQETAVSGWGFADARLDVALCEETEFAVFHPTATRRCDEPDALLVKLSPNVELGEQMVECCRAFGFGNAVVRGIGSLTETSFADGSVLESRASECLFRGDCVDAHAGAAACRLEVRVVGFDNRQMVGRLAKTGNKVLITAELMILKTGASGW